MDSKNYENFIRDLGRAHRDAPRSVCGLSRIRSSLGSQDAAATTSATRDNPTSARRRVCECLSHSPVAVVTHQLAVARDQDHDHQERSEEDRVHDLGKEEDPDQR
jgi:hypothetical protein